MENRLIRMDLVVGIHKREGQPPVGKWESKSFGNGLIQPPTKTRGNSRLFPSERMTDDLVITNKKSVITQRFHIEPVYENYNSLTIKGYRIDNAITVTLRDVNKTSRVVAAALKAGAKQVLDVQFYTSDLRKHRDQARDLAMKAAREKADNLARAAGANAGCVLSINENSWSYYNGWWWVGRLMSSQQNLWS
jgi:uncharacterized protein